MSDARAEAHFRKALDESVNELKGILSEYNSLDIIANVLVANALADPDQYVEALHEGQEAFVEYVALVVLMEPFHEGMRWLGQSDFDRIEAKLKDVYFNQRMILYAQSTPQQEDLPELARHVASYELIVRNPGYQHHLVSVLTELFVPFDDWMEQHLGFTIRQALQLAQAVGTLGLEKLHAAQIQGLEAAKRIRRAVRRYRQSREIPDESWLAEIVKAEAAVSEKKLIRHTRRYAQATAFYALGDTFTFTAEEAGTLGGTRANVAEAYLRIISLGFGEVRQDFSEPAAVHPLKLRPVVRHGGCFLLAAPTALYWGLQPLIEEHIKQDEQVWQRYQTHRSNVLEQRTAELFEKALSCSAKPNLTYPNPDMPDCSTELDALVPFNRALFLVECKAGSLTDPARRGAPQRLAHQVQELVEEPLQQALRAYRYIQNATVATFEAVDHSTFEVHKSDFDVAILVAVTLEPLSPINVWANRRVALENTSSLRRWIISIYDLIILADCVEFAAEFLHFVLERTSLPPTPRIEAADEVDFFAAYLSGSLRFQESIDFVLLAGFTKPFDDYYLYEMGVRRKPAEKPKKRLLNTLRNHLQVIDRSGHPGFAEAAGMLLKLDWKTQKVLVHKLEQACRRARGRNGGIQYFTLIVDSDGYCVMVGDPKKTRPEVDKFGEFSANFAATTHIDHCLCIICDLNLGLMAFTCLEQVDGREEGHVNEEIAAFGWTLI